MSNKNESDVNEKEEEEEEENQCGDLMSHFVDLFNRIEISLILHSSSFLSDFNLSKWDGIFCQCQDMLKKLEKSLKWDAHNKPLKPPNEEPDTRGKSIAKSKFNSSTRGKKFKSLMASRNSVKDGKRLVLPKISQKPDETTEPNEGCDKEYMILWKEFCGKKDISQKSEDEMGQRKLTKRHILTAPSAAQGKPKLYLDDAFMSHTIIISSKSIIKSFMRECIIWLNSNVISIGREGQERSQESCSTDLNLFRLMKRLDTFQNILHLKFSNFEDNLIQLVTSPRDMHKLIDQTFECVSQTYPRKKQTQVKFKELAFFSRRVRGFSRSAIMAYRKHTRKSQKKDYLFESPRDFCSFLLMQALKGNLNQLSNYIKDLANMIKNFAKLVYVYFAYQDKKCFERMIEDGRIKVYPRLICLLVVQILCTTFCDIAGCWKTSGLQNSDKHRFLALIQYQFEARGTSIAGSRASRSSRLESIYSGKREKLNASLVEGERRVSRLSGSNSGKTYLEKWIKDFVVHLMGMPKEDSVNYDFYLKTVEGRPIIKVKMSLWSILPEKDNDDTHQLSLRTVKNLFVDDSGNVSLDLESAKRLMEQENESIKEDDEHAESSPTRAKKVIFSMEGIDAKLATQILDLKNNYNLYQESELDEVENRSSLDACQFSTTELAVELIQSLYTNAAEIDNEEQNTIQVVLPKANINKIQSILASKGLQGLKSTFTKSESFSKNEDSKRTNSTSYDIQADEINQFFNSYWVPKLKDMAQASEEIPSKHENESLPPEVIIRPTFGKVILNIDPALVAKCLVAISLKDDENWSIGKRHSYRDLQNPDISIISKFTMVNDKAAHSIERRRRTSIQVELFPHLNEMLTNKDNDKLRLKMSGNDMNQLKILVKDELTRQLNKLQKDNKRASNFTVLPVANKPSSKLSLSEDEEDEILISSINFQTGATLETMRPGEETQVMQQENIVNNNMLPSEISGEKGLCGEGSHISNPPKGCGKGSSAIYA